MDIWFTSDPHLGHHNIIKYCNRPFQNSQEQDQHILDTWNSQLKPGDLLYILGDLCWSGFDFRSWASSLNTKELHLIVGNHDEKRDQLLPHIPRQLFRSINHLRTLQIADQSVTLCHYPMVSWRYRSHGSYHLFGHVHGKYPGNGRSMDVGVDCHAFNLVNWETIHQRLSNVAVYSDSVIL